MEFDERLRERLNERTSHVYPIAAPRGYGIPAIVYNVLTETAVRDISDDDHSAAMLTVQVDVYDTVFIRGLQTARTLRRHLLDWEVEGIEVMGCTNLQRSIDNTTGTDLYRVMAFYNVFVSEPVPETAGEDGEE